MLSSEMCQQNALQNPNDVDAWILYRCNKKCINFSYVKQFVHNLFINFFKQLIGCKENLVWNIDSDNKTNTDNNDRDTNGSYMSSAYHTALFINGCQVLIPTVTHNDGGSERLVKVSQILFLRHYWHYLL